MDFNYVKATSLGEALNLKAEFGERGICLAGGTDLLVDIRNRLLGTEPRTIIDISEIEEVTYIRQEDNTISIGAGTRITDIQKSSVIQQGAPVLDKACRKYANPLIKNRASIGGNLVNASPAADMLPPLLVLETKVVLKSAYRERVMRLEEFLLGVKRTAQESDVLLTEIRFEQCPSRRYEFLKLGQRNGTSVAIASLALMFDMADGVIAEPRIALGSVAPTSLRVRATEGALSGVEPSPGNIKQAGEILKQEVKPITDIRGSAEYRRAVSALLLLMAFQNLGYALSESGGLQ